jgi:hypothetical protein
VGEGPAASGAASGPWGSAGGAGRAGAAGEPHASVAAEVAGGGLAA